MHVNPDDISPQDRIQALENKIKALEKSLLDREIESAMMLEIAQAVNSELSLQKIMDLTAHHAQKLIQSETLLIPVLDQNCETYTYQAGCGVNAEEIVGESLPLDYGVCGWVWKNKRPWWKGVLEELEENERNRWEKEAGSIIMVPLEGKNHFLGGLSGINKIGGGEFDKRDLDILVLFAYKSAIAIENAQLFENLNHARKQAENYQQELSILNKGLEKRIEKRTGELQKMNRELEKIALFDSLTGLANRSLILNRLELGIKNAIREKKPLSVIMMDLDKFKAINDTIGHDAGDETLKQVAMIIQKTLTGEDTIGRLGGDEFVLVLPGKNSSDAESVARKILQAMNCTLNILNRELSIGVSLGISTFPENGKDNASLLKCADVAMYNAKNSDTGYSVFNVICEANGCF
ncbi:diguanylate cyclase/phosphodiesterase (GGDEF & EAL domains) with PAS/PAC sensor(s) [hydrothermal vent metagenome]|uniref:Diguanylate cyclase/phosphodiesterase (GGDEF & EAL domains) with PAS/PAC sensor(S) n=1 Tax=hydrothermal vent metagenome TaxID=652676 RepID=A0A3B0XGH0_9ZZZZ